MGEKVTYINQKLLSRTAKQSIDTPIQELLEHWKLWIAIEVINQWRNSTELSFDLDKSLALMHERVISPSLFKLKQKILHQKKNSNIFENIELAVSSIEKFVVLNLLGENEKLVHDLRIQSADEMRLLITDENYRQASPQKLVKSLMRLSRDLKQNIYLLEQKINILNKQKNSARQAYEKLCQKLKSIPLTSKIYQSTREAIWNACQIRFESKLKAEFMAGCVDILHSLIRLCLVYLDATKRSVEILEQIQKSLRSKLTSETLSLPVIPNLNRIDTESLQKFLELWIGHSINYWGNCSVTWQQIEAKLLLYLEPVAQQLFHEFQANFVTQRLIEKKKI